MRRALHLLVAFFVLAGATASSTRAAPDAPGAEAELSRLQTSTQLPRIDGETWARLEERWGELREGCGATLPRRSEQVIELLAPEEAAGAPGRARIQGPELERARLAAYAVSLAAERDRSRGQACLPVVLDGDFLGRLLDGIDPRPETGARNWAVGVGLLVRVLLMVEGVEPATLRSTRLEIDPESIRRLTRRGGRRAVQAVSHDLAALQALFPVGASTSAATDPAGGPPPAATDPASVPSPAGPPPPPPPESGPRRRLALPWVALAVLLTAAGVGFLSYRRGRGASGERAPPGSPAPAPAPDPSPRPGPPPGASTSPASPAAAPGKASEPDGPAAPSASETTGASTSPALLHLEDLARFIPDRYQEPEKIGKGGMGVVFRARDRVLGREVALKLLSPFLADEPEARRRFLREARILAGLSHPGILTLFDVQEEPWPFLSMELLEGEDLATRLKRGPLSEREFFAVALPLLDALEYAHQQGVLHRDVKPLNIFLDTEGRPKLLDFGLARAAEYSSLTRAGAQLGSPLYMAPEQLLGLESDTRTDLYSLGLTLYECLAGRPPVDPRQHQRKLSELPIRAQDLGMPRGEVLAPLLRTALAPAPENRFTRVAELRDALEEAARELARTGSRGGTLLRDLEALRTDLLHSLASRFAIAKVFAGKPERFRKAFVNAETLAGIRELFEGPPGLLARLDGLVEQGAALPEGAESGLLRQAVAKLAEHREKFGKLSRELGRMEAAVRAGQEPADLGRFQERIGRLSEQFRSMNQAVNELVGRYALPLADFLEEKLAPFRGRGLTAEVECPEDTRLVTASPHALRVDLDRVLDCLLENAFQAGAGALRLRVRADPEEVRLEVTDDGEGLPPGDPEALFRRGATTRDHGTGTGLPRCRELIEARGGSLRLEPGPGGGTVARIHLPD